MTTNEEQAFAAPIRAARTSQDLARSGREYELDAENLEIFERDGFLTGVDVLEPAHAERLAERVDDIRARARELEPRLYEVEAGWSRDPESVVFHCLGAWLVDDDLCDTVFDPALTAPAAQLLGVRRLRFWHDQIFTKPARHRGTVPWHQDYSYWQRTEPACHITVHIALDDSDVENGCLHYVPGSHRWGLVEPVPFDGPESGALDQLPPEFRERFRPRACELRRGQAVVHHSHTMHGSPANQSDRPRRALVVNYFADGTRSASDEPILRGVPIVPRGSALSEPWFPLVLDLDR